MLQTAPEKKTDLKNLFLQTALMPSGRQLKNMLQELSNEIEHLDVLIQEHIKTHPELNQGFQTVNINKICWLPAGIKYAGNTQKAIHSNQQSRQQHSLV